MEIPSEDDLKNSCKTLYLNSPKSVFKFTETPHDICSSTTFRSIKNRPLQTQPVPCQTQPAQCRSHWCRHPAVTRHSLRRQAVSSCSVWSCTAQRKAVGQPGTIVIHELAATALQSALYLLFLNTVPKRRFLIQKFAISQKTTVLLSFFGLVQQSYLYRID